MGLLCCSANVAILEHMDKENFMDTKEKKNNKKNPKRYSLTLQTLNLLFRGYWFELHKPQSH
jgi:hypothetical protein